MSTETATLADAATLLAGYALAFGRIDRTACLHPDGVTPESDTDHTVMLAWVAPAIADLCFPELDPGLVAQFAIVHDAVEVFAGDTPTLRITDEGRAAKRAREAAAVERWYAEFSTALPWMPAMIGRYEEQQEPEARFVRAADKILPKLVHPQNGCSDLRGYGVTVPELQEALDRQREDIESYAGEFGMLMILRDEAATRLMAALREAYDRPAIPGAPCSLCGSTDLAGLGEATGICLDATVCQQRQYARLRDRAERAEAKLAAVTAELKAVMAGFFTHYGNSTAPSLLLARDLAEAIRQILDRDKGGTGEEAGRA